MAEDILVQVDAAGIAVVTLNRPEKRNAVSLSMWRGLGEIYTGFARSQILNQPSTTWRGQLPSPPAVCQGCSRATLDERS